MATQDSSAPKPKPKVQLSGSEQTLFIPLYRRACDAEAENPILGDPYAKPTLETCGVDLNYPALQALDSFSNPGSLVSRAKTLDGWTRDFLSRHEHATVVQLACGLDSRSERVKRGPGVRWIDVELPRVAELRKKVMPYVEQGDYKLLSCDATDTSSWTRHVPVDRPTLVIAEGLFLYLPESQVRTIVRGVVEHFGAGELICDVTPAYYIRMFNIADGMKAAKVKMAWGLDDPKDMDKFCPGLKTVDVVNNNFSDLSGKAIVELLGQDEEFEELKAMARSPSGGFNHFIRNVRYTFKM